MGDMARSAQEIAMRERLRKADPNPNDRIVETNEERLALQDEGWATVKVIYPTKPMTAQAMLLGSLDGPSKVTSGTPKAWIMRAGI